MAGVSIGMDDISLTCYSAYRKALRDLKFAIERVGDNFKPYGMNNWKGMVAVIDMVLQDPEKLMRSVSLTGYTIPEPYQGKYKKWAEKKRKEMAENRQQRLETCSMCKWREPNYPMPRGNDGWCCARYHTCNPWGEARNFEGRKNNVSNL